MTSSARRVAPWFPTGFAVVLAGLLGGCTDSATPDRPTDTTETTETTETSSRDEVGAHQGKVCPRRLPRPDPPDPNHGLGTQDPASSAPGLPSIESAWICRYIPLDVGPDPGGNGTTYGWLRAGPVVPVPATEVPGLDSLLSALRPVTYDGFCTADLGRRYMLVFSHGKDLTGVALDDFGCSDARLTDEPFTTVLGESTQPGIVPGVFRRSEELLAEVKDLYPDA